MLFITPLKYIIYNLLIICLENLNGGIKCSFNFYQHSVQKLFYYLILKYNYVY